MSNDNTPQPYTAIELARFIWKRVMVKNKYTNRPDRIALLIAVDAANEYVRVRYLNSRDEQLFQAHCVQPILRHISTITKLEQDSVPEPFGADPDHEDMALLINYLISIGVDTLGDLETGRAIDAAKIKNNNYRDHAA